LRNGFGADFGVPMWTRFMKVATKDDKPEWPSPPAGVTTALVCRMSGQLAGDGCQDVEVVANDGHVERRSMVYTEYFARGTVPTVSCELHQSRGLFTKLAGVIGIEHTSAPAPPVADTGLP